MHPRSGEMQMPMRSAMPSRPKSCVVACPTVGVVCERWNLFRSGAELVPPKAWQDGRSLSRAAAERRSLPSMTQDWVASCRFVISDDRPGSRYCAMPALATLYRNVIPRPCRELVWRIRNESSAQIARDGLQRFFRKCGRHIVRTRVNGLELHVDLRDEGVGRPLFVERRYEPGETAFVVESLKPGMVFVDIGANIGYYSTLAAKIVGNAGVVHAIEPEPHNFELLAANATTNRLQNISCHNVALGAEPGTLELFRSGTNYGDHRVYGGGDRGAGVIAVPVKTLDDLLQEHAGRAPDFIKMDVQGFEYSVLQGMTGTLEGRHPLTLLTEFWPHGIEQAGGSPAVYFNTLVAAGFSVFQLVERDLSPITYEQCVELIQAKLRSGSPEGAFVNLVFRR
jgi:FkbM family methyltransferase